MDGFTAHTHGKSQCLGFRVVQRLAVIPPWKSSLRIRSITAGGGTEVADFELSETVFSAG